MDELLQIGLLNGKVSSGYLSGTTSLENWKDYACGSVYDEEVCGDVCSNFTRMYVARNVMMRFGIVALVMVFL